MANSNEQHENTSYEDDAPHLHRHAHVEGGLKSKVDFAKTRTGVFATYLTHIFGSMGFLYASVLFIAGWILVNTGYAGDFPPFDPYPFVLLMMIISPLQIFVGIIVLMTQSRQEKIDQVRQQIDFEIDVRAEHEVTKILYMLDELRTDLGIAKKEDKELEQMKEKIDIIEIKQKVELDIGSKEKK
jgi:uncharacterized membrane protein